jgi:hypothetical protein
VSELLYRRMSDHTHRLSVAQAATRLRSSCDCDELPKVGILMNTAEKLEETLEVIQSFLASIKTKETLGTEVTFVGHDAGSDMAYVTEGDAASGGACDDGTGVGVSDGHRTVLVAWAVHRTSHRVLEHCQLGLCIDLPRQVETCRRECRCLSWRGRTCSVWSAEAHAPELTLFAGGEQIRCEYGTVCECGGTRSRTAQGSLLAYLD